MATSFRVWLLLFLSLAAESFSFPHNAYANSLSPAPPGTSVGTSTATRPSWVDCYPKSRPFQLISWNLLAPCYAPTYRHPWSLPQHLEWPFRRDRIVETLLGNTGGTLPDILCFQEVQVDLWESDLKAALEAAALSHGTFSSSSSGPVSYLEQLQRSSRQQQQQPVYTGILQKVKKKPIANAILVRNDFAKILKQESRSRALILVLELPSQHRLVLANVHLQAGVQEYHQMQRFYQISSLLNRIDHFVTQYSTETNIPSVVITGDFNMTPCNPLYHLLSTAQLPSTCPNSQHYQNTLTSETMQLAQSIPQLPLCDAYQHCIPAQGRQKSSYTSGHVIDYLWTNTSGSTSSTSGSIKIHQTWQSHPDALLDPQGMFLKGKRYPNDETPSDHLPIGAILELL